MWEVGYRLDEEDLLEEDHRKEEKGDFKGDKCFDS